MYLVALSPKFLQNSASLLADKDLRHVPAATGSKTAAKVQKAARFAGQYAPKPPDRQVFRERITAGRPFQLRPTRASAPKSGSATVCVGGFLRNPRSPVSERLVHTQTVAPPKEPGCPQPGRSCDMMPVSWCDLAGDSPIPLNFPP
jgi:hypothetical protein